MCKGSKLGKKKKEATKMPFLLRLRGGGTNDQIKNMIDRAIVNGKMHGIDLHPGVENLGNGNCAFECVLDSINTRECFQESYDGTPDYWRMIWMSEVEIFAYEGWNRGYTREQWSAEWQVLKYTRSYECQMGDLVLPGIAHNVKKDIVIFNG